MELKSLELLSIKMPDIMDWNYCERNFIKKVEIDEERIKSIIEKSMKRLKRARKTKIAEENADFIVEDYYEVIKELLTAYLLKNGLRSKNHQCLISYFYKQNKNYEKESYIISQMSFFRNKLEYYGEDIPFEFLKNNKEKFEEIVEILLKL